MNHLQNEICNLLDYSHEVTGFEQFILYGGTPLDIKINGTYSDIDLATRGKEEERILAINKRFLEKGFDVIQPRRLYQIQNGSIDVILVYAKDENTFFDVCFMDDLSLIGLFDLESSFWQYPEKIYVDQHNALEALASKCIRPIRSFDSENPLLWLSRFVCLCSKYNIQMTNNPIHVPIINAIYLELSNYANSIDSSQYSSALSSVINAILQANDRRIFSDQLIETELISKLFPQLNVFLKEIDNVTLIKIKNREDFCNKLMTSVAQSDIIDTEKRLSGLKYRNWENGQ